MGLPLAEAFAASLKVIGFDINHDRISHFDGQKAAENGFCYRTL